MVLTLPGERKKAFLILELQYDYKISFIGHVWAGLINLDLEIKWVIFRHLQPVEFLSDAVLWKSKVDLTKIEASYGTLGNDPNTK
jgi:hypothetical protein